MTLLRWALAALLLAPAGAHAAAGSVLFALGRVEIERAGQMLPAQRGAAVEVGDTITTGPTGLAQLRMKDGALLSLRAGTTMTVEDFRLPARAMPVAGGPAAATAPAAAAGTAAAEGGRSVLRLLRGAFRTVTGLIGKNPADDYQVRTPVATIGIRGTDYSAAYCAGGCGGTADGLYVGVSNGEVYVANDSGQLVLADNQYAYVRDASTPPRQEMAPPDVLEAPIEGGEGEAEEDEAPPPDAETGAQEETVQAEAPAATDDKGYDTGLDGGTETGAAQPEGTYELLPGQPGTFAFGVGPFQGAAKFTGASDSGVYLDEHDGLIGFLAADTQRVVFYSIGTAVNVEQGFDDATGLRWGRWSEGAARVGDTALDLTTRSLHWIYALAPGAPVLPTSGTATFTLIGNTNPTDNAGNTGFLGSATLTANFTNQTVASSLSIGINSQVWQASGSGSLFSGTAVFAGSYGVNVNSALGSPIGTGSGSFTGFFTDGAAAAGLGYSLTSGGTTVSGAAAFQQGGTP